MKILVGVSSDSSALDAIALAALLQKATGAQVVLGHIYPHASSRAGIDKVDLEWVAYLQQEAQGTVSEGLEEAEAYGVTDATTDIHGHHSSGVGLNELAETIGADMIVIGSAPGSANGRFLIGSTADQLLHGSRVPVALATAGYRRVYPRAIGRLVVAFQDTAESRRALQWAAEHSDSMSLTALTVLIRHRIMGSNQAFDGEMLVARQALEDAEAGLEQATQDLDIEVDLAVCTGDTAQSAIQRFDWHGDELLVLASATGGVLRRVFLGDMTYKLIRGMTVPAVVLPRHT